MRNIWRVLSFREMLNVNYDFQANFSNIFEDFCLFKEGSFRVVTLLKIHVWKLACRCISIQQSVTRSGRMLSDEFLSDLDYVQPVQRGIWVDFPVVASCLRPVSTPVSATMISMTCCKLQNGHSVGLTKKSDFFFRKVLPPKMSKINF